jgi:hypothetical protein
VAQKTLKLAKPSAPISPCRTSSGWLSKMPGSEPTTRPQGSGSRGYCTESLARSASPSAAMASAAPTNVPRQPIAAARKPLAVRESKMPVSRPLITVPMAAPRCSGFTSATAKGTAICGRQELKPSNVLAIKSTG